MLAWSAVVCLGGDGVPEGYVALSAAPGYAEVGPDAIRERYEREVSWAAIEPMLPEDPWLRARAVELWDMAVRTTARNWGQADHETMARWWDRLERAGWSHPYTTTLSLSSLLAETPRGRSEDEVLLLARAAADALAEDDAYASLPPYRAGLALLSLSERLAERDADAGVVAGLRDRGHARMTASLQVDRPAVERGIALGKMFVRVEDASSIKDSALFLDVLGGSARPDPYAVHSLRGILCVQEAWAARGGGFAYTVSDEAWAEFAAKLERADEELRAAYAIDAGYFLAPAEMVTVAMAGHASVGNDPRYWHWLTLKGTPTYTTVYRPLLTAMRPRWNGSIEAMGGVILHAAEHSERVPEAAYQAALMMETLGDDLGDARMAWRIPSLWPPLRDAMERAVDPEEGLAPLTGSERDAVLSLLIVGAWLNGEYEAAERYYLRNGESLDWERLEPVRLDWWEMTDTLLLMATPARPYVLEARRHTDAGRWDDAAKAWGRAASEGIGHRDADGRADELIAMRTRAELRAAYERGEWIDLTFPSHRAFGMNSIYAAALQRGGVFEFADNGLVAQPLARGDARLIYQLPLGERYRLEAELVPRPARRQQDAAKPIGGVGVAVMARYPWAWAQHWTVEVAGDAPRVRFGYGTSGDIGELALKPEALGKPLTLTFERDGRTLSAWANDELVGERVAEESWLMGEHAELVAREGRDAGGAVFTKVRVRRLPDDAKDLPDF